MFELQLIMYYQLLQELGQIEKIVQVEGSAKIEYGADEKINRELERRFDIIVQKSSDPKDLLLVEAKSLRVKEKLNTSGRPDSRNWAKNKFKRWSMKDSGKTTYHRQYTLDKIATTSRVIDDPQNPQIFGKDYVWWFHSWNDYKKPRKYKTKTNGDVTEHVFWAGVPPDADEIGTATDRDWHRAADRMAQVGKGVGNELKHSIGMTSGNSFFTKQDLYGTTQRYYLDPSAIPDERFEKVKMFNIQNMVQGVNSQLGIPDDLLVYYESIQREFENKAQFVNEMVEGLEAYDIPIDVPVAEWVEKLNKKMADSTWRLTDSTCDY